MHISANMWNHTGGYRPDTFRTVLSKDIPNTVVRESKDILDSSCSRQPRASVVYSRHACGKLVALAGK
jgi:hypothetical protein